MVDNVRLPDDAIIEEDTAPYAWVKCGTDSALMALRIAGFTGWVAGGATAPAESGRLYEAARAAETATFRTNNPVGDSQMGLVMGIKNLYGVTIQQFRPSDLGAFLKTVPGYALIIPLAAYFLKGAIYDLDHFSAGHRTPTSTGHDIAIDVRSGGIFMLDPLQANGSAAVWVPWESPDFTSLVTAYNQWGRDAILGLKRGSLAPKLVPPEVIVADSFNFLNPPTRFLDTRPEYNNGLTGAFVSGQTRALQITGRFGVPAGAKVVLANIVAVAPASGGYLAVTPSNVNGKPPTSTENFPAGDIRANFLACPLDADGCIWITYNSAGGTCHVVLDVAGYVTAAA